MHKNTQTHVKGEHHTQQEANSHDDVNIISYSLGRKQNTFLNFISPTTKEIPPRLTSKMECRCKRAATYTSSPLIQ